MIRPKRWGNKVFIRHKEDRVTSGELSQGSNKIANFLIRELELWAKRETSSGKPLPDLFCSMSDIAEAPHEIVGRNKLVLKTKNAQELRYLTTDDE
jgi:hypothetical protein